ncbi:MAG: hypothetical protein J7496_14430 [Novosphingobium sp.]|nr:hypothetical protein [Novosphingobium sp.]
MVSEQVLIAISALLGVMILSATTLRGWQGWLALKERELDRTRHEIEGGAASGAARIELADLKERIRKLEAIASGVDL